MFRVFFSGLDNGERYVIQGYSALACEDRPLDISCPDGYAIQISTANFGRQNDQTCISETTEKSTSLNCDVSDVLSRLTTQCNGNTYCYIDPTDADLDPNGDCPDVFKYLNMTFTCACKYTNILKYGNIILYNDVSIGTVAISIV